MPDTESGAILMAFFIHKNKPIVGESTTAVKAADGVTDRMLMGGFAPNNMFEVDRFTFSTKLDDDQTPSADSKKIDDLSRGLEHTNKVVAQHLAPRSGAGLPSGTAQPTHRVNYARWRASTNDREFKGKDGRNGYMVNVQPVRFSRQVDKTSFELMKYFLRGEPFHSAALVKRKPSGSKAAGEAFLRIDFEDVLIT